MTVVFVVVCNVLCFSLFSSLIIQDLSIQRLFAKQLLSLYHCQGKKNFANQSYSLMFIKCFSFKITSQCFAPHTYTTYDVTQNQIHWVTQNLNNWVTQNLNHWVTQNLNHW